MKKSLSETEAVLLEACKAALALFDKDHAMLLSLGKRD